MQDAPAPTFHLEASYLPPGTRVLSFRGRERIGHPYVFDIVLAVPRPSSPDECAAALFDRRVVLALSDHPDGRRIAGFASRVRFEGPLALDRYALRLRLVPGLSLLRRRRMSRVFQALSVPEIIARMLDRAHLPCRLALTREHPKRAYCVQYRETDLDFILRLTREEGIVLWFDDPAPGATEEIVVLSDSPAAHSAIRGRAELTVRALGGDLADPAMRLSEHDVHKLEVERRGVPGLTRVQVYDAMRPRTQVAAGAAADEPAAFQGGGTHPTDDLPGPDAPRLVYEHHGDDEKIDVDRHDADRLLVQARRRALRITGTSMSVRLAVGRSFELAEHDLESVPRELLFVALDHEGKAAELAGASPRYEGRFSAIPASLTPRPRPARRTPMQVTETAVVVGPPGHEVHTDEYGRIKIQFHWDLDGARDEHSSCWIRVAQLWAGQAFGALFTPRVGMEVVVTFVGGDLDRPIVTGALYHAAHPPPFALPADQVTSGLVTRSSPGGGGGHELSFDDARGRELLRLRSERDLELSAKHDARFDVAMSRADSVGHHARLHVAGDRHIHVEGSETREVQGSADESVFGDRTSLVMGKTTVHAEGPARWSLGSGGVLTSLGPVTAQVQSDYSLMVGTGNSLAQTSVAGRYALGASETVTIRADRAIRLQVGMTTVDITAEGIKLNGKALSLKGEQIVAEGNGPRLTLDDEAELVSQRLGLFSRSAGLELAEEGELWGAKVKLNGPKTAPDTKGARDESKTRPFKVKLTDANLEPYADKHYELFAEGARFAGATGSDGGIDVAIPEEATRVDITCWIDDYPTGRKKTWSVRVAELPPASTPEGALMRLHNLGYYTGKAESALREPERAALRWFQKEHDLEETGELDGDTVSELEHVHGS